jgi:HSP20 family molecular chaperone IbpA
MPEWQKTSEAFLSKEEWLMFIPMIWTDRFDDMDDMFDDTFTDPFDDMISLVAAEPTKDEIESAKSIDRHAKKEGKRYYKQLRSDMHSLDQMAHKYAMKTDVVEEGDHFTVKADLPGFDKKDIKVGLQNGILTVSASHSENNDEKDDKTGKYLRRERQMASYERSFEVSKDVKPEEIHAKYENGVLTLTIPNKNPQIEQKNQIAIE